MEIVKPWFKIRTKQHTIDDIMVDLEEAGRTCYKSEDRITKNSADDFIRMIIDRGHETVLEHASISVRIVCDRGVSHEIVRHRLASYSQESTRYCDYSGNGIQLIHPPGLTRIKKTVGKPIIGASKNCMILSVVRESVLKLPVVFCQTLSKLKSP